MDHTPIATPIPNNEGPPASHKGVQIAGASRRDDNVVQWLATISVILGVISLIAWMYVEYNWKITNAKSIDDILLTIFVICLLPWLWGIWKHYNLTDVALRRARVVVDTMETALDIDIDRNNRIGPKPEVPVTQFTLYVSKIFFDQYPTTKEAAAKIGISYEYWKEYRRILQANDLTIQLGKTGWGKRSNVTMTQLVDFLAANPSPEPAKKSKLKLEKGNAILSEDDLTKVKA